MSAPVLTNEIWYQSRIEYLVQALAAAESALETNDHLEIRETYEALEPLIQREIAEQTYVFAAEAPEEAKRWNDVLPRLHEAYWGFAPTRGCTDAVCRRVVPELVGDDFESLCDLAGMIAEISDGAPPIGLADTMVMYAEAKGFAVTQNQALRLLGAMEGFPVLPLPREVRSS